MGFPPDRGMEPAPPLVVRSDSRGDLGGAAHVMQPSNGWVGRLAALRGSNGSRRVLRVVLPAQAWSPHAGDS